MNDRRPITAEDLLRMRFPSEPRLAPDGSAVLFVLAEIERENNRHVSHLWLVPLLPEPGLQPPRQLTFAPARERSPLAIVHRSKFTAIRENASNSGVLIQALPFAPR